MSGFTRDNRNNSILGGGMVGVQPITSCGGSREIQFGTETGINRSILRRSFGNMYNNGLKSSPLYISSQGNSLCGSFRAATCIGDVRGAVNSDTNKIYGIEANTTSARNNNVNAGGLRRNGTSSYSGNPRHVSDASDFLRYRKLKSINQTYNDKTFGGDDHRIEQHARRRLRSS